MAPRTSKTREPRQNDPERTKADILDIATEEFAAHGLTGARVDTIAERTRTSKRMIYYYFGGKEGLYQSVLEKAYADTRAREAELRLDELEPPVALRRLVESTFDYDEENPHFIRLVAIENINHARYIAQSKAIRAMNAGAIETLATILKRGQDAGLFKLGIDPTDLHMMISAFCFFRVSNRYTFREVFGIDMSAAAFHHRHREMISATILAYVSVH